MTKKDPRLNTQVNVGGSIKIISRLYGQILVSKATTGQ